MNCCPTGNMGHNEAPDEIDEGNFVPDPGIV